MGFMTIREAANFLNVTIETMRTWDKTGKLPSYRTEGGHRRYDKDELIKYLNTNHPVLKDKITIAYARVSTSSQKDDLERQEKVLTNYCEIHGYKFKVISDIGSGLNYNKKGLKEVIELISNNRVDRLVINYKDRLIRFGFELIEQLFEAN